MKAKAFQIHWHNKQPIYSVDFHPTNSGKLATCGGDNNVRIWNVVKAGEASNVKDESLSALLGSGLRVEYLSTLTKHMKSVNCVRFSPSGEFLASAGDGGFVILWQQSETPPMKFNKAFGEDSDEDGEDDMDRKEYWNASHQFRAMDGEDVYDLAWSPDSKFLLLGLTDNTAQIWDLQLGKCVKVLKDHQHFVQGVAWDPLDQLLVTQSSDRSAKIWVSKLNSKGVQNYLTLAKYSKISPKESEESNTITNTNITNNTTNSANNSATSNASPSYSLFHDETLVSFFRRPSFSPDGSLLCFPTGQRTPLSPKSTAHGIYLNPRNNLHRPPAAFIGGFEKAAIAIRFNPRLFQLIESQADPLISLPYRMIYAVVTQNSVYIFDTQNRAPLFMFANLHYASLTDVTWSADGIKLVASSVDGFCTVAEFDAQNDFGSDCLSLEESQKFINDARNAVKSIQFFIPPPPKKHSNSIISDVASIMAPPSSDFEMIANENNDADVEMENVIENKPVKRESEKPSVVISTSEADTPVIHNPPVKRRIAPTLLSKQ